MGASSVKTGKKRAKVSESAFLREALLEARQRLKESLAQIEKALSGENLPTPTRTLDTSSVPARRSPLDKVKAVAAATADLREKNGKLSAARMAKLYGVSLSQLAEWLGRTKESLSKTPDSDSLQAALGYFERVARQRLVVRNDAEFRQWLRTPHDLLGASPLELMAQGDWQAMADQVEDTLT